MTAVTRRERVEQKERAILEAAAHAFVESGYDGARMADIAKRAGVAEGTVYLYFKTKTNLMRAFVADFWGDLTQRAEQAVADKGETFEALAALAAMHLQNLIERFDVVELTQSGRVRRGDTPSNREFMKAYVAVFDRIWRRGMDRGELIDTAIHWQARDIFFGGLEYAARTIRLHNDRTQGSVVDNLIETLKQRYAVLPDQKPSTQKSERLLQRLEAAVTRLEKTPNR